MKELFKKDSKNKIRVWKIRTSGGALIQESGILDGKLVKHSKLCSVKNYGKSNETTPTEQALLELESEYKSKLTEGYFPTKDEAKNEVVILPMLAKSYDDERHKIDYGTPVYIQPKLDGMRCLAIIKNGFVTLLSRDGKIIAHMDHIINDLVGLDDQILDGELYIHGRSFQENMKLIKKYVPNYTEGVKYHVYDIVSDSILIDRMGKIETLFESNDFKYLVKVPSNQIYHASDIAAFHSINMSEGYEGSIIRHGNKPYGVNKRCNSLLKHKDFQDIVATIVDVIPNESNPLHGTPVLNYSLQKLGGKSTATFKAGVKMSHEDREDLLKNKDKYIGKSAEIRFFEWTDGGLPRFPVMVGIRLDK